METTTDCDEWSIMDSLSIQEKDTNPGHSSIASEDRREEGRTIAQMEAMEESSSAEYDSGDSEYFSLESDRQEESEGDEEPEQRGEPLLQDKTVKFFKNWQEIQKIIGDSRLLNDCSIPHKLPAQFMQQITKYEAMKYMWETIEDQYDFVDDTDTITALNGEHISISNLEEMLSYIELCKLFEKKRDTIKSHLRSDSKVQKQKSIKYNASTRTIASSSATSLTNTTAEMKMDQKTLRTGNNKPTFYHNNLDEVCNELRKCHDQNIYNELLVENQLKEKQKHIAERYQIIPIENMLREVIEELRVQKHIIDLNEEDMKKREAEFYAKLNKESDLNEVHQLSLKHNKEIGQMTRQIIYHRNHYEQMKIEYESLWNIYNDAVNGQVKTDSMTTRSTSGFDRGSLQSTVDQSSNSSMPLELEKEILNLRKHLRQMEQYCGILTYCQQRINFDLMRTSLRNRKKVQSTTALHQRRNAALQRDMNYYDRKIQQSQDEMKSLEIRLKDLMKRNQDNRVDEKHNNAIKLNANANERANNKFSHQTITKHSRLKNVKNFNNHDCDRQQASHHHCYQSNNNNRKNNKNNNVDNNEEAFPNNTRNTPEILDDFVQLLKPDMIELELKELQNENMTLKNVLHEMYERSKLLVIGPIIEGLATIEEHLRKNNEPSYCLEKSQVNKNHQYNDRHKLIERVQVLHKYIQQICNAQSIYLKNLKLDHLIGRSVKNVNIDNESSPYNSEKAKKDCKTLLREDTRFRSLVKELEMSILNQYTSDTAVKLYTQEILRCEHEIHYLKEYIKRELGEGNKSKTKNPVNGIDMNNLLHNLQVTELKLINVNHELILKDMELKNLNEVFLKQNSELEALENFVILSQLFLPKSKIDDGRDKRHHFQSEKDDFDDIDGFDSKRLSLLKQDEYYFILKNGYERIYNVITTDYQKKLKLYAEKIDELRKEHHVLSNDGFKNIIQNYFNELNAKKIDKRNQDYMHIDDVLEIFNRTMYSKAEYLNLIEDVRLFIYSQLKRWEYFLRTTDAIASKRHAN